MARGPACTMIWRGQPSGRDHVRVGARVAPRARASAWTVGEVVKLAPWGRTLLVHHMPGAPPTSPSKQSCQRELSHGLCPIPVRSSVWGDTAPGTITPALD